MRHQQRGISFIGILFVGAVLACTGIVAAQVLPTLMGFQAITKAATKAAAGNTVAEVRSIFDKAGQIDDIHSISGKDLDVSKEGDKTVVVKVERKVKHPLYGKIIRRSKKYHAHDEDNSFKAGETVRIEETRPISKLKTWKVLDKVEVSTKAKKADEIDA